MKRKSPIYWINAALVSLAIALTGLLIFPAGAGRSFLIATSLAIAAVVLIFFRKNFTPERAAATVSIHSTDAQEKIAQLSAERDRLRGILLGMIEGVAVTDPRGTITLANPAFYQMFQLDSRSEGKTLLESLLNKALQQHLETCVKTHKGLEAEVSFRMGTEEKICMVSLTPLASQSGGESGAVLVFFDVTMIRRLEGARKDFVANVSHELKTPLTSIRGYAETLLGNPSENSEVTRRFLEKIEKNAGLLQDIIEDLFRISEIESGRRNGIPNPSR
jgi:two-component system phosphate regulon sensor histidine kinase PhoR